MRSLFYITILFFSISMLAQQPNPSRIDSKLSPEQQAELRTKKLALDLDLNEKQIASVQALELENAKTRQANRALRDERRLSGNRPNNEERFQMKTNQLDAQKEHQDRMKKILTKEQYDSWKEMCQKKNAQRKKSNRMKNKRGDGDGPHKGNKTPRWN